MRVKQKKRTLKEQAEAERQRAIQLGLNNPSKNEFAALLVEKLSGPYLHIDPSDIAHLRRIIDTEIAMTQNERIDTVEPYRPQPTPDELGYGNFNLPFFVQETNARFSPSREHIVRGAQIMSATGFGKTTTAMHIISGLMSQGIPVVIFDSKGTHEFDVLQKSFPVLVLKVGKDFFFNPFHGHLAAIREQGEVLGTCTERHDSQMLISCSVNLFVENPTLSRNHCLTLSKLEKLLPSAKPPAGFPGFNPKLLQSMLSVTSALKASALGHAFQCERGIDFDCLIRSGISLIVDSSNLSLAHEEYLIASIGWKIYEAVQTISAEDRIKTLYAVIYVDEATSHVSTKLDKSQRHLGPLATLALRARGAGLALILSYHSPRSVSPIITANAHVSFVGHLLNKGDMETVEDGCALTPKQALSLPHLGVGEFMVKLGSGYTFPFLIRVDPINRIVLSQEEIEIKNATLLARLPRIEPERDFDPVEIHKSPTKKKEEKSLKMKILEDIHNRKFIGVTARIRSLKYNGKSISLRVGESALAQLEKDGLVESFPIRLSQRGAATVLYLLTESGYKAIGSPEDRLVPRGGTSLKHRFLQEYCIQEVLRNQGIKALPEAERNGKYVDVGFERNGVSVAIEIALTTEHSELKQVEMDLAAGWNKVIVLLKDRKACKRTAERFKKEFGMCVGRDVTIAEFWHLAQFAVGKIYTDKYLLFNPREYVSKKSPTLL